MNILLDQNISFRVVTLIEKQLGNVKQVRQLGLQDAADKEIWQYARKNNFTIITFDSDFIDLTNLRGVPPRIIWLRCGNSTNLKIANKILANFEIIREFIENPEPEIQFLEID